MGRKRTKTERIRNHRGWWLSLLCFCIFSIPVCAEEGGFDLLGRERALKENATEEQNLSRDFEKNFENTRMQGDPDRGMEESAAENAQESLCAEQSEASPISEENAVSREFTEEEKSKKKDRNEDGARSDGRSRALDSKER